MIYLGTLRTSLAVSEDLLYLGVITVEHTFYPSIKVIPFTFPCSGIPFS